MALTFPPVAGVTSESFVPSGDLAGSFDVRTQQATLVAGAGTIVYLEVLGRITGTGKLTKHNPAAADGSQVAVALAAYGVTVGGSDVEANVITSGEFSMNAVTFNAATNTDALKLAVFPVGSDIIIKKPAFGA